MPLTMASSAFTDFFLVFAGSLAMRKAKRGQAFYGNSSLHSRMLSGFGIKKENHSHLIGVAACTEKLNLLSWRFENRFFEMPDVVVSPAEAGRLSLSPS